MNKQDMQSFAELITATGELYRLNISPALLELYWSALKNFDITDIKQAFNAHALDPDAGQFMPKPADVVRALEGSKDTQAMRAWSKADRAIRSIGPWQSVVFDDPIIHAVIADMGGWITLCNVSGDEYPFKANEFAKRYQGYVMRPPMEYPRKLIGAAEAHNSINGRVIDPPRILGDQQQARLVYEGGSDQPKTYQVAQLAMKVLPTKGVQ